VVDLEAIGLLKKALVDLSLGEGSFAGDAA
jgi:hypothetical protein